MNRLLACLSLLVILMAACQPIRPESELTPSATGETATTITDTVTMTDTLTITDTITATETLTDGNAVTTTIPVTPTTASTPTGSEPRSSIPATSPATSESSTNENVTSCPAIGDAAVDIDLFAHWQEGQQRTYLITQSVLDNENGQKAITMASTTTVTVTVISTDADGYVLEWSYGQSQLGETDVEVEDPIAAIFQMPLEVQFRIAADSDGAYVELLDIEKLQDQLLPLFDQLFDLLAETDEKMTPEVLQAARELVDRLVKDPANFEALFTREVQLFHTLYGFSFEDAEPLILPDLRPNMLGGAPIPSELTITPTHYDADRGCLHVELENVADPVAARNSILETLQEQAKQMGVPGPTEADLPAELNLVDNVRFEIELAGGWPTAIYTERAVTIATQSRVETSSIVLVEPE